MTKLNRAVKPHRAGKRSHRHRNTKTRPRELASEVASDRLVAQASDPVDGVLAAMGLATMVLRGIAARRARISPPPFVPASRLLTEYQRVLYAHVGAIGDHLHGHEVDRLARIAPGFMAALNAEDPGVVSVVVTLLQTSPDVVALWMRANLDAIERRFS